MGAAIRSTTSSWPRSRQRGLQPAPEADRRTLARRVSLDLTGLPPAPAEVEAFVADAAPDAYEKLVDRLLQSPHWGEHRGRYWLDAARYADTHGIHFDNYREMWAYRDWVIDAFNRNLPFDQFTDRAAGRRPAAERRRSTSGSPPGFNRCNITTNEGGAIAEEYLVLYARDRTETTAQVWLGLTAGLRGLPRPQVRPAHASASSTSWRRSSTTRRKARWTATSRTRRRSSSCRRPEDRARWDALGQGTGRRQAAGRRTRERRPGPTSTRGWRSRDAGVAGGSRPGRRAALARCRSSEGEGRRVAVIGRRPAARPSPLADGPRVGRRTRGRQAPASPQPAVTLEVADAGDFEQDQAFSFGAWVKLPKPTRSGAVVARMDDQHDYPRLGPVGRRRPRRHAHHPPVAGRRPEGRRQRSRSRPDEWHHVLVTYDGSRQGGRREGLRRRRAAADRRASRQPEGHDPHRACR